MMRAAVTASLVVAALTLTACSGADGGEATGPVSEPAPVRTDASSTLPPRGPSEPAGDPSPSSSSAEPEPGTTVAPATEAVPSDLDVGAPEGWQTWQVDRVVFALPGDLVPSADRSIPSASVSFFAPLRDGETVSGAAFFVETGAVGPLQVRTQLLEQVRTSQTGTEPVRGPEEVDVPGSAGATRIDYAYDLTVPETGRSAASLQVDVTIQMPDPGPNYGVFLNALTTEVTEADLTAFVASFRVLDAGGGLPG
ncbi:hypothetical protein [Aquipuribacter hungaricus]|uniref:Lipoprotein n=1 Tax=Aquipuribacter hungaricus TaxID=545624 RepID=A0ABV7WKA0_9MICO